MLINRILTFSMAALCVGSAALASPCSEFTVPPAPPETDGYEAGLEFSQTREYKHQFTQAVQSAKKYCLDYKRQHPQETNLAVVSDIDETLLDNRPHFRQHPVKKWDVFDKWVNESKAPVLEQTYDFLKWARLQGFAIFLITGRPESDRKPTIINLLRDGADYDGLYLRAHHGDHILAEVYKSAIRKEIEEMGFKIVVNIGDQFSDLAGGYSLDCEKLPNKMYFIK